MAAVNAEEREEPYDGAGKRSPLIRTLRTLSFLLPGEYLKTWFYLNCIDRPRRMLREALLSFYRYDHVYSVLREFAGSYNGRFSVLEFGTSDGYSFVKLLYATRYLKLTDRIVVHTFDSFEGMPAPAGDGDRDWTRGDDWVAGEFKGNYQALDAYCRSRCDNFQIHPGYFEESINADFLDSLAATPPILIWVDSDYYSSARTVFERLVEHIPNGCVIYFDDLDNLNYGSRLTGEARLVHEINHGLFGDNIELVLDTNLSLRTGRIYRFLKLPPNRILDSSAQGHSVGQVRRHADGSPLP